MITLDVMVASIDPAQVFKTLGYSKASPPGEVIQTRTIEIAASVPRSLRACCTTAPITEREHGRILTEQGAINSPAFGELAESADTALFALVTAGPGLDARIEQCDDAVDAMILDAVGSVLVEQGVAEVIRIMAARLGKHLSLPFSPGYCDYPLTEQETLFRILNPNPLGVEVCPGSFMMTPLKTVSFICAAGPSPLETNPCRFCRLDTCQMRRTGA